MADNFDNTESIDVLIGSDYYWDFVSGDSIKDNQGLTAVYSKFGWLLSRPIHNQSFNLIISGGCNSMFEEQDEKLVESLKKFWESESVGIITQDHSLHADKQKARNSLQCSQLQDRITIERGFTTIHEQLPIE